MDKIAAHLLMKNSH